jgi:HD-GYP domain-containing protein (c-di-GMP phosphodiesterase class II)
MTFQQADAIAVLIAESQKVFAQALTRLVSVVDQTRIVGTSSDPAEVLDLATRARPDVAIVDLDMSPDCSLVRGLHESRPDLRIIALADRDRHDGDRIMRAMVSGCVGVIYKDDSSYEDLARAVMYSSSDRPLLPPDTAGVLLESYLESLSDNRRRDISAIQSLAIAVEARDHGTGQHLHRVTDLALRCLARIDPELALDQEIAYGFLLHDVGKIGIPDAILNKCGELTEDEWSIMRRHPEIGAEIVRPVGLSKQALDVILYHHERWDGSGYPFGLAGTEIPLAARVFAVADAFDAMTSRRPYRRAMNRGDAMLLIRSESGTRYDSDAVEALAQTVATATPLVIDLTD